MMKPLLTRSNSSPQSSPSTFLKKSYRPGPISPYHLVQYHSINNKQNGNEFGSQGGGLVAGWLSRRGSVPDHRQEAHGGGGGGGGIGGQSRSQGNSRKGSVAQQEDNAGKQRHPQEGRKANAAIAGATLNVNATTKTAREVKEELGKARKYRVAMEEISHSIQRIETSAGQQITQLSDTYESAVGKLEELQAMTTRFAELQKLTTELVDNFAANEEKFVMDMGGQIKMLGAYQEEVAAIRVLQRRLDLQRRAVDNYKSRLEAVEDKISRQKELEVVWRQRASRRIRILWGIISVVVILWLLATSHDSYLLGLDDGEDGDEQAPEQQFMEDALGVKFEYGSLPKEVLSLEADRLLRERHHHDEP